MASAKQRQLEGQIGNLQTPLTRRLIDHERSYLCDLSRAARTAGLPQIALNSVVRAQQLHSSNSPRDFAVSQEFSSVLWMQKEEKMAVAFLLELRRTHPDLQPETQALLLAQLVSSGYLFNSASLILSYRENGYRTRVWNLQWRLEPTILSLPIKSSKTWKPSPPSLRYRFITVLLRNPNFASCLHPDSLNYFDNTWRASKFSSMASLRRSSRRLVTSSNIKISVKLSAKPKSSSKRITDNSPIIYEHYRSSFMMLSECSPVAFSHPTISM